MVTLNRAERAEAGNVGLADKLAGMEFLGQVITWNSAVGKTVPYVDVLVALRATGLDDKVAKEFRASTAFSRAVKVMSDNRIVRPIKDANAKDDGTISFQFTAEVVGANDDSHFNKELRYDREAIMKLDKSSGEITSDNPELAEKARELLREAMRVRTAGDITRLVQKLFDQHADLFPVRPQGGVYFVPQEHTPFVEQVKSFLGRLGGHVNQLPVPAGTQVGDASVTEIVANGLDSAIRDYVAAVEAFDVDTRADTLERATKRIKATRAKVTGYGFYLKDESDRLDESLAEAEALLAEKVRAATETQSAPGYKNPKMTAAGVKAAATKAARLAIEEPVDDEFPELAKPESFADAVSDLDDRDEYPEEAQVETAGVA